AEKAAKESMTKEQKKALAAERKERRETLRVKYGVALLDGKKVDFANYMVEPPGLFMGRGCVAADTIVKTDSGVKYVQEVQPGDAIAVHHGSHRMFYKPVASLSRQGVRPVLVVRTRTHFIRATENHPMLALSIDRTDRRNQSGTFSSRGYPASLTWKMISDLEVGDYVVTVKRYQTPGSRKFSNTPRRTVNGLIVTPKLARVLGYYLGDGFTETRRNGQNSHLSFSEGHEELVARYSELCEEVFGIPALVRGHVGGNSMVLSVYSREIADIIDSLGFHKPALEKRVPGWVFSLVDDLKIAFIRGYLDADGNFFTRKTKLIEYGSFGFESTNKCVIEDLRELAVSAGLQVSNLTTRRNHGYSSKTSHRFFISEYASVCRLLDPSESLRGPRTRLYSLNERSNELKLMWDWSRLQILESEIFALERVLAVSPDGQSMTFDISMADKKDPNFIANGFVVHNSHPLRGRWKPRVRYSDVILNLGETAPVPPGDWKEVVHDHNSMWMAKWVDKLTDKEKYVWLHESTPIQQSRSRAKYDNAARVGSNMRKIEARIGKELSSKDPKMRQVATVCYLIHKLGMRVGDEKDEDEADTVGASTLRVEHIKIMGDTVEFDFLGKDSVPWKKTDRPLPQVLNNLEEFKKGKAPETEIFHEVTSNMVNQFLSSIVPGLTAKVFRTWHATDTAKRTLESKSAEGMDEIDKLYHAKEANLQAAIFCNHQRTLPKSWQTSYEKKKLKLEEVRAREKKDDNRLKKLERELDFYARAKNYNLNTSLKNYIDPRIYKAWCDYVGLDWAKVYSKSLQRKFSWALQTSQKRETGEAAELKPVAAARRPGENAP
ncbi:MAG TPA: LAGLIDADG family homing endonuclease, partial [Nitrososphaerales archaeon]|nr:LAGLIDADG family homing endonuclease [Nitrososphaerales archaeon]